LDGKGQHGIDAVAAVARIAAKVNGSVEKIGARRLQTGMERMLNEVSFTAADRTKQNFGRLTKESCLGNPLDSELG
jgi:ATP-dependent protease HslVU (ClpYQ) ATPase subunit